VTYLTKLKVDQMRKAHLEEEYRAQVNHNRKLLSKLQVGRDPLASNSI
jgi:hypothetical protein